MGDKIDMSLDDIIKLQGPSGRKQGRGAGPTKRGAAGGAGNAGGRSTAGNRNRGSVLRNKITRNTRTAPYARASTRAPEKWQHDMYDGPSRGSSASSHLLVSNLDYGVSDNDIQELFAEFGQLRKAAVHYDRSGRSLGTADVIFDNKIHAVAAMKQYNGVLLDGRPMKITLVPAGESSQRRQAPTNASSSGNFRTQKFSNAPRGGGGNRVRGRGGSMAGARGPRRAAAQPRKAVTAEELDADLDAFLNN